MQEYTPKINPVFPARYTLSGKSAGLEPSSAQVPGYDGSIFVGFGNAWVDKVVDNAADDHDIPQYADQEIKMNRYRNIILNYYQHPNKRKDNILLYSRAHDIYSLGCVLLEIGLWVPLDHFVWYVGGQKFWIKTIIPEAYQEIEGASWFWQCPSGSLGE